MALKMLESSKCYGETALAAAPKSPQACRAVANRLRPNPSLKRSANGMAPWPRGAALRYHAPRGQGATPSAPA
jgi:hypothetical protein